MSVQPLIGIAMASGSQHHQCDAARLHVQLGSDHNCYTLLHLCAVKRLRVLLVGDAVRSHMPRATVGDANCHKTENPPTPSYYVGGLTYSDGDRGHAGCIE